MKKNFKVRQKNKGHNLTGNQKQILKWLQQGLTPEQIAKLKGLDKPNSIYNTIRKLKNYGYVTKSLNVEQQYLKDIPKGAKFRLHAEAFSIKILYKDDYYYNLLKVKNNDIKDSNKIELYKNRLVIYFNKDFWGKEVEECFVRSSEYFTMFLRRLENDYNIILIKERNTKIYKFRQHLADVRNPIAKQFIEQHEHFEIRDDKGDLRLIIDNSFVPEFEAVNNKYCREDMQRVVDFNKDLVLNPESLNLSELTTLCKSTALNLNQVSRQLDEVTKSLQISITLNSNLIKMMTPKQEDFKDKHDYGSYFM